MGEQLLQQLEQWNYIVGIFATMAFAITGVLAITEKNDTDLLGATVFGMIAGIGGGTIRDIILQRPPVWSEDQSYILVAVVSAIAAFYLQRPLLRRSIYSAINYLDGLGAAMFAIQTTGLVWHLDFARPAGPILLGVITGIGGGLLRDVLASRPTLLLRQELYATPVLLGCIAASIFLWLAPNSWRLASLGCIAGTFLFRAAAIHWGLTLPNWATSGKRKG